MTEKIREAMVLIIVALILCDKIIALIRGEVSFISDILKPLLLYAILRNLREASTRLLGVIWVSKNMIILLIIYYALFGWVSSRIFRGTSQGNAIFPSREEAIWNMLSVFAGSNFLVKVLPSYGTNRLNGLVFLGFNILGILFFTNVTVAIIYNSYLSQVHDRITNFKNTVEEMLTDIFNKYDTDEDEKLTIEQAKLAIQQVIDEKTRGEYNKIKMEYIIIVMDKPKSSSISKERFLELMDVLHVLREIEKRKAYYKRQNVAIPNWRRKIYSVYQHKFYEGSTYLIIIFSLLMIFWREWMETYGLDKGDILPVWIIMCVIINLIFLVDLIFRFLYQGFLEPLRSFYALLEIGFQLTSTAATLKYFVTYSYSFTIIAFEFIILVRLVKILQLLDELRTWKIILKTLRHLVVPFLSLFMVQLGIIYTYSIIGERIYGGKISTDSISTLSEVNLSSEFIYMNFNDLISSIITLMYFSLSWTLLFKMYLQIVPGIISQIFTFSFFLLSVLCLWNIMISVAVEVYSAVSNYYDTFARSKVKYVDDQLRKKMLKLKELEKTLREVKKRTHSHDPKHMDLMGEDSDSKIYNNYQDYSFVINHSRKCVNNYFIGLETIDEAKEETNEPQFEEKKI